MTPVDRFLVHLNSFLLLLPAVRDGNADAIHDARVATRRMRAALPLLRAMHPADEWDEVAGELKRATRALGQARDIDVAIELLDEVEARAPIAAPAAAVLRSQLRPEQTAARRRLIKKLEKLSVDSLRSLQHALETRRSPLRRTVGDPRVIVADAIAADATGVRDAFGNATAIYFPRRSHALRIALKKFRYTLEAAMERENAPFSLKVLRRAQEALGRIHDRQVLLDRVDQQGEAPATAELRRLLEAEARTLYAHFVQTRADVLQLCDAAAEWAATHKNRVRKRMLTMGIVAVPSAALMLMARKARAS